MTQMFQDLDKLILQMKTFIILVLIDIILQQIQLKKLEKANSVLSVKHVWNMNIINILMLENSNVQIAISVITKYINQHQMLI